MVVEEVEILLLVIPLAQEAQVEVVLRPQNAFAAVRADLVGFSSREVTEMCGANPWKRMRLGDWRAAAGTGVLFYPLFMIA